MPTQCGLGCWLIVAVLATVTACQAEPKVRVSTQGNRQVIFQVEVADTPAKRAMGLQYRRELADDHGMIFLFTGESPQTFWMKNTPIPLDMIFIDRQRKIVGIVAETVPFSLDPRSVGIPSQYVLEIKGGLAKRLGIRAGDAVRFDGIATDNVTE